MSSIFNEDFQYLKMPLKYLVSTPITDGPHETPSFVDSGGVPFLSVDAIQEGQLIVSDERQISFDDAKRYGLKCQPRKGDILVGKAASTGKVAQVKTDVYFSVWSPLAMIRPNHRINATYLEYFLKSQLGQDQIDLFANVNTQKNVGMKDLENTKILVPDLDKQLRIANFLDLKVGAIDSLVLKEEETIKQLSEYRFILITKLILEGLNQTSFKETGVKWMPKIPSHWSYTKIGSNCYLKGRIGWQGLTADEYQDAGPYLITGTDFDNGGINWNTCVHITEKRYVEASHIRVRNGDVLITKDGTVGKVAIVENMPGKASLNSGVMLMRNLKGKYENKYLYYVLSSNVFWDWFYREKKENSTIVHLYQEQFEKFSFPLPPKNEQLEIAEYLDRKCKAVDELIKLKEQKIEKLKEYKKSLIYECVTGRREI